MNGRLWITGALAIALYSGAVAQAKEGTATAEARRERMAERRAERAQQADQQRMAEMRELRQQLRQARADGDEAKAEQIMEKLRQHRPGRPARPEGEWTARDRERVRPAASEEVQALRQQLRQARRDGDEAKAEQIMEKLRQHRPGRPARPEGVGERRERPDSAGERPARERRPRRGGE